MTREEAIQVLQKSTDNTIEMTIREWEEIDKKVAEAIDMAIEALQGGDAEMDNCQAPAPQNYMQQSRQADMLLVDLNSKDGYLLDGKYKVNGCEDLTDGRVEVVRCKECRHFTHYADGCGVCSEKDHILTYQNQNDFCSYGERSEP